MQFGVSFWSNLHSLQSRLLIPCHTANLTYTIPSFSLQTLQISHASANKPHNPHPPTKKAIQLLMGVEYATTAILTPEFPVTIQSHNTNGIYALEHSCLLFFFIHNYPGLGEEGESGHASRDYSPKNAPSSEDVSSTNASSKDASSKVASSRDASARIEGVGCALAGVGSGMRRGFWRVRHGRSEASRSAAVESRCWLGTRNRRVQETVLLNIKKKLAQAVDIRKIRHCYISSIVIELRMQCDEDVHQ